MQKPASLAILIAATALLPNAASALDGIAANGETVFKKCASCHAIEAGKNKVGPSMAGIVGRVPGTVPDFKYSKAMVDYGVGKVWDDANLAAYLVKPKDVVEGTKMSFAGLKQEQDIADVIAYLKGLPQ